MRPIKESLRSTIELLGDEEARQTLAFAQRLRKRNVTSLTLKRLARDPAFNMPCKRPTFRAVEPIKGKGLPASDLLVEERR